MRARVPGDHLGGERARGLVLAAQLQTAVEDDLDPVGPAEIDVVADGGLEPRPSGGGTVEDRGVGDLELTDREGPAVAGPSIGRGEGAGQHRQPPVDQGA